MSENNPKVMILLDGKDPMELFIDFDVMAKVEAIINAAESRRPNERVSFLDILNDSEHMTMDRFRYVLYQALVTKQPNIELKDISDIYSRYARAYTNPAEKEVVNNQGKTIIITVGAKINLTNKIVEATDCFLGLPSQSRAKEEKPPMVETKTAAQSPEDLS